MGRVGESECFRSWVDRTWRQIGLEEALTDLWPLYDWVVISGKGRPGERHSGDIRGPE